MVTGQVTQSNQKDATASVQGFLVRGLPMIREGDDLAALIQSLFELQDGDILCIASTVIAKLEGCFRSLGDYNPGTKARELAQRVRQRSKFCPGYLGRIRGHIGRSSFSVSEN